MAQSCLTFPTLTSTNVITSQSLSTSLSSSVTTVPPETITSTLPCPTGTDSVTCSAQTTVITIPGTTSTIDVTITTAIDFTTTELSTLYGSSCSNPQNGGGGGVTTPSITRPTDTVSQSVSVYTPPPSIYTSQSYSTMQDGSVVVSQVTVTSTLPLVTQSSNPQNTEAGGTKSSVNIGAIVGGAAGGFFGLLAIAALVWFIMKRRNRWDGVFDDDMFANPTPTHPPKTEQFPYDAHSGHGPGPVSVIPVPLAGQHEHKPNLSHYNPAVSSAMATSNANTGFSHRNSVGNGAVQPNQPAVFPAPPNHSHSLSTGSVTSGSGQRTSWAAPGFPVANSSHVPTMNPTPEESRGYFNQPAGSSTGATSPASQQHYTPAATSSAGSLEPPRPVNEKAHLVHLDGSMYQEGAGSSSAASPAPPAYTEQ